MSASLSFVRTRRAWLSRGLYDALARFAPLEWLCARLVVHRARLEDVETLPTTKGRALVKMTIVFEATCDVAERYVAAAGCAIVEVPALAKEGA